MVLDRCAFEQEMPSPIEPAALKCSKLSRVASLLVIMAMVAMALSTVAGTIGWAWRHGTLRTTEQERIDFEFERIVRRMDASAR